MSNMFMFRPAFVFAVALLIIGCADSSGDTTQDDATGASSGGGVVWPASNDDDGETAELQERVEELEAEQERLQEEQERAEADRDAERRRCRLDNLGTNDYWDC